MTIWGDADSLPVRVRELCARRSLGSALLGSPPAGKDGQIGGPREGKEIRVVFVSAKKIPLPPGRLVEALVLGTRAPGDEEGPQTADDYIIANAKPHDIIVTRDIPLAERALKAGLLALNDRGTVWTADTVRERLSVRNFMASMREDGLAPMSKANTFGPKEENAFANALDRAILLSGKESVGL